MEKIQADSVLNTLFDKLSERIDIADSTEELITLNDAILKTYMMMLNAGAFGTNNVPTDSGKEFIQ